MYEYKCQVAKVVDGDTIYVNADLGFMITAFMKLRFRGVDTPEIRGKTRKKGLKAKRFVEEELSKVKFIGIKSYKIGKYGRYIADIYYFPGCDDIKKIFSSGKILNKVLIKKRLAKKIESK